MGQLGHLTHLTPSSGCVVSAASSQAVLDGSPLRHEPQASFLGHSWGSVNFIFIFVKVAGERWISRFSALHRPMVMWLLQLPRRDCSCLHGQPGCMRCMHQHCMLLAASSFIPHLHFFERALDSTSACS